ncbi:TonB-dependent receptor [Sphingobacterium phlebotomi]|uniref:TonB-dependent receptor n=1 Tax=Sphingobacterium phlebotomi TaxID=2605433 RepID=A0A5D4H295_9SPHI|nr:TonB-dependent receptor [Sphingobacterium phlebotomi]TYR34199.1 TonB-dependent receptor [Sphingobacterium phlebotomi]
MKKKIYLLSILAMIFMCSYAQQTRTVDGVVLGADGAPLQSATVSVSKGVTTTTNPSGEFSVSVNRGDVITVSLIGYKEEIFFYKDEKSLRFVLTAEEKNLDEVVVIGYGTAKRRDLVGAVDQISGDKLQNRGNMNISRALQGQMPGLNISMRDGKPSRGATLNIRGQGSIGAGGSALILIDGVEGDMTTVNPDDVESVSVLKDASSAAIYGARGAFGVVLITTKRAKQGKPRVSYSGGYTVNDRIVKMENNIVDNGLEWTDGWYKAYMEGMDLGTPPAGINNVFKYSTDWYNELVKRNSDDSFEKMRVNSLGEYEYFGNTNWFDIIYKDYNLSSEHNVSVTGGGDNANYYVSGRVYDQDGIYNAGNENYRQYNFRAKGEVKILPNLVLNNNTDFIRRNIHQPMVMYDRQLLPRMLEHQGYPMTLEKNLDGTWTEAAVYMGWAGFVEGTSYQKNNKFDLRNTTTLTYDIIPNSLIAKADFTYLYNHSDRTRVENMYDFYTGPAIMKSRQTFSSLEVWNYTNQYIASNATLNYIPQFNNEDHSLNILAGFNIEEKITRNQMAYRRGLLYPDKPSFALMDGDFYTLNQTGEEWAYAGALFRVNYNYKGKYLAEFSGRYDGSSKFPTNQQWGFFPSASVAWRASDESFIKDNVNWISDLKFRASVGSLGNGNVDPFLFIPTMNIARTSYIINDGLVPYTYMPANIPESLTWERSTTYDVGVDLNVLNNRMSLVFDYYQRYTTDMFTLGPELPHVFGATVPRGNYADLKTKGWEVSLEWRDQFSLAGKPFNYGVRGMLWDNRSWVTKFNNNEKLLSMTYYEGMEIGEIWGYSVGGLFRDQDEINNYGVDQSRIPVSGSNILKPGDMKFLDLNEDGEINQGANTVGDPGDQRIIGNSSIRMQYGFHVNMSWNNIGLSAFFQGVGRRDWYPARESAYFWGQYSRPYGYMLKEHVGDNVWTEENQNENAYWPRYRGYLAQNANRAMTVTNDRFLQNAAYLRLKNFQIDYTLRQSFASKYGFQQVKVFVSGENVFTWSPLYKRTKSFDPEVIHAGDTDFRSTSGTDGDGYGYPMLRTFSLGLNLTL